jgi:hypothetical protein
VPIKILSLLDLVDADSIDIKPLKPQLAANEVFPPSYSKYTLWGGLGLALCAIAGGLVFWWWRRRRQAAAIQPLAWEVAFERLAFLKVEYLDKGLPEQLRAKDYYVELTELARAYLGRIYDTDVLEMTTEEFMAAFHDIELPTGQFDHLADFFKHADRIKFARFMPETKQAEDDFLNTHDMIERVRTDFLSRQEVEVNKPLDEPEPPPVLEEQDA